MTDFNKFLNGTNLLRYNISHYREYFKTDDVEQAVDDLIHIGVENYPFTKKPSDECLDDIKQSLKMIWESGL